MPSPSLVTTIADLRHALAPWRREGIALVPTMGALHAGHMALVQAARRHTPHVVVSIFVNPTQFSPQEDFGSYPRTLDADRLALADANVPLIFAPSVTEMYPEGFATTVSPSGAARGLEADSRPHFFDGVATVVAKLLLAAMPAYAMFGEKDYQQLLVVKQLVKDLALPMTVIGVPTMREADGLAMSSRNARLAPAERAIAGRLNRVMADVIARLKAGSEIAAAEAFGRAALAEAGFDHVDYIVLRDAQTLAPLAAPERPARLMAAVRIGKTRLIDNMAV